MIDCKKINCMKNDKRFKSSNALFKHLKYSMNIIKENDSGIALSISSNGLGLSVNITKLIFFIGKPLIIAHEIADFKLAVITRAFEIYPESLTENIDFGSLITKRYYWIEESYDKLEILKDIIIKYLTDSEIKEIILDYFPENMSYEEKDLKYKRVIRSIKNNFNDEMSKVLKMSKVCMDSKYYMHTLNTEEADEIYLQNAYNGSLTNGMEG